MIDTFVDFPEEDSPDLTDEEMVAAIDVTTLEEMTDRLLISKCSKCFASISPTKHQLRRRAPHLYARVLFVCKDGHQGSVTFRAHFLTLNRGV
jgi:hypothetical protein